MTSGTVVEWRDEDGWGVLQSDATPGGCWVHASMVRGPLRRLVVGSPVDFTFEAGQQDGYDYRGLVVVPEDVDPDDDRAVYGGPSDAYRSSLSLTFDDADQSAT
jgi:CspA family cold shock protein